MCVITHLNILNTLCCKSFCDMHTYIYIQYLYICIVYDIVFASCQSKLINMYSNLIIIIFLTNIHFFLYVMRKSEDNIT